MKVQEELRVLLDNTERALESTFGLKDLKAVTIIGVDSVHGRVKLREIKSLGIAFRGGQLLRKRKRVFLYVAKARAPAA